MEFKGRVILDGSLTAEAVVSRQGFNTLASCQKSVMAKKKQIICSDQNNPSIYNKNLTGKVLCLPKTIGSTTGGMVLQTIADLGIAPAAMLFSENIDSLAASGVILADIWNGHRIITVDGLGDDFLNSVQDGMTVEIRKDGTVILKEGEQ
ncbi:MULTISPECIES: aconitase X swivel domain-containing protein [unclassified Oceanispirochaeta]|uniref:aconitase X swivel domain-containing protein n=1 Tax=unclassified Oceanispirochaeta TaxID=2635722 RepID=UPI000E0941FF|nr:MULTISPECIES: DUF126 domain-containing protein [unclassified Oceanispirochaeta]NPD74657.1 DUF126 domain-containing protein [Oceanispirochaeta sp. M1]RDG29527.1 DUF126 domain-containing protein [Oceanispirochaeta sp. M1]